MDLYTARGIVQSRSFLRVAFVATLILLTGLMFSYAREKQFQLGSNALNISFWPRPIPKCGGFAGSNEIWADSQAKYQNLRDDKFTIALQTYRRPTELNDTLQAILADEIPSLLEVVIVWNDMEITPPPNYKSKHGIPVRYRRSAANSLNQKLWPDPEYKTQAIFLSDDDIYFKPKDLEFVFQSWRKFGRRRMTGGFTRCTAQEADGKWKYSFCSEDDESYSMILTNLAFVHISFLGYYSSHDDIPTKIRAYVDEHFNCEDIAMNYLISLLTGEGPLLVKGYEPYVSFVPKIGISSRPGHVEARSQCIVDFNEMFQCMPLISENAHVEPGLILS